MAASSSLSRSEYDVFLSFRGADTRKTFVGHLYTALNHSGFRTFKDDERLGGGRSISLELLKYINESKIAVIVFSKNYANSSWCLDELVEILNCWRTEGQIVLPIFYHVKPWEVRQQKGSFEEAFGKHEENYKEDMERVQTWRAALKEAANLSGLDLEDAANGYENELIKKIVQVVSKQLPKPLHVAEYEVGINARVDKIIELLEESQLVVGICGIGGAGKTTVAKAVFNRISNSFKGSCFLHNVREESTKYGEAELQTIILRKILMDEIVSISYRDEGINVMKDRLRGKRLLLVLDDVDNEETLKYLVGGVGEEWFDSGSRIMITTRDKRLLENYNAQIYDIELLNDSEALQLFSRHAFKKNEPEDDYVQLSLRAIYYVKGLPLALKVLGSHLYNRTEPRWSYILNSFKTDPVDQIHSVLKISYEGLNEVQKHIFLDVACLFNGYSKEHVMNVSKWSEDEVDFEIQTLRERSLINISEDNNMLLSMHDLIQEMGRKIVLQESKEPGKRSRLWSYEDIREVFNENTVTENIEAIMLPSEVGLHVSADAFAKMRKLRILKINGVMLDGCLTHLSNELRYLEWHGYPRKYLSYNFYPINPGKRNKLWSYKNIWKDILEVFNKNTVTENMVGLHVSGDAFAKMRKLRILKISGVMLDGCLTHLSKELRYLEWDGYPQEYLPYDFHPKNPVQLHLLNSLIKGFGTDTQFLKMLKYLDLSYCKYLGRNLNFSEFIVLEELNLSGCDSLVEVEFDHMKIQDKLKSINLVRCKNLRKTPNVFGLPCLVKLRLWDCLNLVEVHPSIKFHKRLDKFSFPTCENLKILPTTLHMKSVTEINLSWCSKIEKFPEIEGDMECVESLWLDETAIKELSSSVFKHLKGLRWLSMRGCKMLKRLPNNIGELECLKNLYLSESAIEDLPPSVAQLKGLEELDLRDCKMLGSLPDDIGEMKSLRRLKLRGSGIKKLPASFSQLKNLGDILVLDGCLRLQTLESLPSSICRVQAKGCVSLQQYSIPKCECISYDREWNFSECHKLVENHGNNKPNVYHSESQLQEIDGSIVLPGSEIPSWFTHIYCESGIFQYVIGEYNNSVCLTMDPNSFRNLKGVCVCAVFGIHQKSPRVSIHLKINGCYKSMVDISDWIYGIRSDHIILFHRAFDPFEEEYWKGNGDGCYIKVYISSSFSDDPSLKMKKWGIHPIMDAHKHGLKR